MGYREDSLEGRFLAGDAEVHEQVVRWVARVLTQPRFRLVRRQWLDLHQEVLARIVESLRRGRFDAGRDFRVYCQSIARYAARDAVLLRMKELRVAIPVEPARPAGRDLAEPAVIERAAGQLLALASEDCRELLRMLYFEEASYEEIARRRGIPIGTVKSRLFRCLEKVRESATRGNHGGSDPKVRNVTRDLGQPGAASPTEP